MGGGELQAWYEMERFNELRLMLSGCEESDSVERSVHLGWSMSVSDECER